MVIRKQKKIFIIGIGRGGTTILLNLLASHSKLVGLYETNLFKKAKDTNCSIKKTIAKVSRSKRERKIVQSYFERKRLKPRNSYDFLDFYCRAHQDYLGKSGYVEKTPAHTFFAKGILKNIIGSKIIAIIRDPRAIVASRLRNGKASRPYFLSPHSFRKIHFWLDLSQVALYFKELDKLFKTQKRDRIMFINYKDLVKNPDEKINEIFRFINIDSRPVHKNINPFNIRRSEAISSYGKINSKNIFSKTLNNWIKELNKKEKNFIKSYFKKMDLNIVKEFYPSILEGDNSDFGLLFFDFFSKIDDFLYLKKNFKNL